MWGYYTDYRLKNQTSVTNESAGGMLYQLRLIIFVLIFRSFGRVIAEFERINVDVNVANRGREPYITSIKDSYLCQGIGPCVSITECGDNYGLEAARRCYNGDKSVFCGVDARQDPMVCCPRTTTKKEYEACGKTLVQGKSYWGLGAYPFVVRVGFRSKLRLNHPNYN